VAPVQLAAFEADRRGVGAHRMARLVQPRADGDNQASVRSRPASRVTRSSFIPFWATSMTPSVARRSDWPFPTVPAWGGVSGNSEYCRQLDLCQAKRLAARSQLTR
jgi:hypothetical protein